MNITNKNVTKYSKIIEGFKYYELNIKKDYYYINITNLPKENLIKIKLFLKKLDETKKEIMITYENEFSLDYFTNQTKLFNDLGVKSINDLVKFFQTYFTQFDNKKRDNLINYINDDLVILKLLMMNDKIQINIELYQIKINNKNLINNKSDIKHQKQIKLSNSCKNMNINVKKKLKENETKPKNKINEILLSDYHVSLMKKRIPFLKNAKNFKLNLIYKSSSEKDKNFHRKCDNKGSTLIIILTTENRMFLTVNMKSWNALKEPELNNANWRLINTKDDEIFIFDLYSKKILKIKKAQLKIIIKKEIHLNLWNNMKIMDLLM